MSLVMDTERTAAEAWLEDVARPQAIKIQRRKFWFNRKALAEEYWDDGYAIGGEHYYVVTPTGIGPAVTVFFKAKGVKMMSKNVTDYSTW